MPEPVDLQLAYSVDRSWGNVRHNSAGDPFRSDDPKMHRPKASDEALPACGARVILNTGNEPGHDPKHIPNSLCRRCFPQSADSEVDRG